MFHYLVTFYGHEAANIQLVCLELYCIALCILAFVSQDVNWVQTETTGMFHHGNCDIRFDFFSPVQIPVPPPTGTKQPHVTALENRTVAFFFFFYTFYRFQCFKKQKSLQMNFTLLGTSQWRCVLQCHFFVKKEKKKSTAKNAVNCRLLLETPVKMSDFFDDRLFPKLFHF